MPRADSSCLIREACVVNAGGRQRCDVLVRGGKIAALGEKLAVVDANTQVIEAEGRPLLPGGVDPHVHLAPFVDDFESGSKAALAGGITTIGVMSFAEPGESLAAMLDRQARVAAAHSQVDVVLHAVCNFEGPPRAEFLDDVIAAGQTTCKLFTIAGDFNGQFAQYIQWLHRARAANVLPMFHCEDQVVLREALLQLIAQRRGTLAHYEQSRPVLSEELAVHKVLALCELTDCPVYIVHVSSARALHACEVAQRRGLPVYVETRPIYMHFDRERYRGQDGALYTSFPPIRSAADGEALLQGMARGSVHTVGSDHAPRLRKDKLESASDLANPAPGMSNLQEMLPMLYSEGVVRGRLTLEQFVQVTSTHAARLLSLYPRKGCIAVGSDADMVLWDPERSLTITLANRYSRADFSIFDGITVTGVPRWTMRAGEMVFRDDEIMATASRGSVLRRPARPAALAAQVTHARANS